MSTITLADAKRAAETALSKASGLGIAISVSVVDATGRLVMTMRGDGAGFFTTETSRAKATAAAAFRKPTKDIAELHKTNPAFWSAVPGISAGELLPATGAVPLMQAGKLIGAIGCGGGTPDQDHECAAAAAESVAA